MRHELSGVVAAVGLLVVAGVWSDAVAASEMTDPGRTSILVRTYTQPASARDLGTARRTASAILGQAGIQVVWVECALTAEVTEVTAQACTQPLRRNELLMRIVSAGTVDSRPDVDTLGFAFVDLDAGGGWLATVYADRVGVMAKGAGVDAAELLGRTMAHEVGHLLLGTNRHAPQGLMRASWSGADLRRNRATQWLFDGKDGEVMRRGITSRLGS